MIKAFQKRHILILLMVILLLILVAMVLTNLPRGTSFEEADRPVRDADLALQTFEYTETRSGHRHWTIEGDSAGYLKESGEALIENLRVYFFDESGDKVQFTLQARHGRIRVDTREMHVWDDVVIETSEGDILTTQSLEYHDELRQVSAQGPVHIQSKAYDIQGQGMRMDVTTRRVQLLSDVKAVISTTAGAR